MKTRSRSRRRSKSRKRSGKSRRLSGKRSKRLTVKQMRERGIIRPSKYRGPPQKRRLPTNRSPKKLGHNVSTEWIKDKFIVKIKKRDGTIVKFIPPFAMMTGVSSKTGKPLTRRLGRNDLDSLTKEQRAILGRF